MGEMAPEEKVTPEYVDQRTSTTETLNRLADPKQVLQAGAKMDSQHRQTDKKNRYLQHKTSGISRAEAGTSMGTDPIDFDDLKTLGRAGEETFQNSSDNSSTGTQGSMNNAGISLINNSKNVRNSSEIVLQIK